MEIPNWLLKIVMIGVKIPEPPPLPVEQDPKKNWKIDVPKYCRACGAETYVKRYSQFDEKTGAEIVSYVTAQCALFSMNPTATPPHTSMQWHDGSGWYSSPNNGPMFNGTSVSFTSLAGTGYGHSKIKG